MKLNEVDINKVTPMMKQYIEIKNKYLDVILFFRLGDFYEMFFEDGITASKELEIALTGKNAGLDERIPMCGIPYHAAEAYIEKLINKGYKVAICEQIEDPSIAKGIVKRDVIRVITKGTITSNESLNEKENNFIGSVVDLNHCYSISYADITTGELYVELIDNNINKLISEIVKNNIKEIIVESTFDKKITNLLSNNFNIQITISDNNKELEEYKSLYNHIDDIRKKVSIMMLLNYLNDTQKTSLTHMKIAEVKNINNYLEMDIHTKTNLELTETVRNKTRNNSLLWLLDKTKTAPGARLLKKWIENPLVNIDEINKRYNIVETLLNEFILKEELKELLNSIYDLERLCSKVAYGSVNARDMLQLISSLEVLPEIKKILNQISYEKELKTEEDLCSKLKDSIYEEPPIGIKEGYLIKTGYSKELDELKELRSGGKVFISKLEAKEREKTGIKNLKVGFNKVFGYYIEVTRANSSLIPENAGYIRKQTLANSERYITNELKEKEDMILGAEEKIINLEYELFSKIREEVKHHIPVLQDIASIISEIDVLLSFATVSEQNSYIKPNLIKERNLCIKENRHPVVEKVMNNEFVPNDIIMDESTNILLITGPNMSGKSTYMRQLAITIIMAQIGCYIPAVEANIPIFDKIFTRIGASDDLVSGESTFMVEMNEANNALANATENSLILFDELGRGTATYDGMSLAYAIIEYIHNKMKCKTLFSTHYHELTDLENSLKNLKNIHVSALEEEGEVTFLHKIKEGPVDKSYGLHVAKLAKMPESLLQRAEYILNIYEKEAKKENKQLEISFSEKEIKTEENEIEKELKNINLLEITPIEALNILNEIKEKLNKM